MRMRLRRCALLATVPPKRATHFAKSLSRLKAAMRGSARRSDFSVRRNSMHGLKKRIRSLFPASLLSIYHLSIAYAGALIYGFPSRSLLVIGVTGTKGKTSTTEMIGAIFED